MIVVDHQPAYVPIGGNRLMLLGEFSRTVTVECAACEWSWPLKLIADDVLTDDQCDELLNSYLRDHGWGVGVDDTCPTCATSLDA